MRSDLQISRILCRFVGCFFVINKEEELVFVVSSSHIKSLLFVKIGLEKEYFDVKGILEFSHFFFTNIPSEIYLVCEIYLSFLAIKF